MQRVRHALGIYDLLRIDHFRGFDTYWAIPAGSATAKNGKWEIGPQMCIRDSPYFLKKRFSQPKEDAP